MYVIEITTIQDTAILDTEQLLGNDGFYGGRNNMSKSELRGYNFIEDFVRMNEDPLVFSLENV